MISDALINLNFDFFREALALRSVLESVAGATFSAINRVEDIFPEISNFEPLLDSAVSLCYAQLSTCSGICEVSVIGPPRNEGDIFSGN